MWAKPNVLLTKILIEKRKETYRILRFLRPEKSTLVILVMLFLFKSLEREKQDKITYSVKITFSCEYNVTLTQLWKQTSAHQVAEGQGMRMLHSI